MDDQNPRDQAPVPSDRGLPVTPKIDANGFDPTEFEWRPVPRRPRADGWTPEVQQRFIEALARFGVVERACEEVHMSVGSAYRLRNAPGGEGFRRAWAAVLANAADRLLDMAFEHAIEGEEVPVFDADGLRVGAKRRYNTRMAMFLLRAYHPERFGDVGRTARTAPPPAVPMEQVIATLAPVTPAEPHRLAEPSRLNVMVADARDLAAEQAQSPPDDREVYRHKAVGNPHPAVLHRARRRSAQRREREDRADRRYGLEDVYEPSESGDG